MTSEDQGVQGSVIRIITDFSNISVTPDVSKSVVKLIQTLRQSQDIFQPSESEKESLETSIYSSGELAKTVSLDLCYAVKRLIRGLASSNSDIRIRYGIALAAVFSNFSSILPIDVIRKWSLSLLTGQVIFGSSSMSRGEQSSLFAAKLACIASFIEGYPSSGFSSDQALLQEMVIEIISIAKARTFLREPAFKVLSKLLKLYSDLESIYPLLGQIPLSADFLKFLHELDIPTAKILLKISARFEKFPVLNNMPVVMECLFETISTSTQPHSLWLVFVDFLKSNSKLQEFWSEKLENSLFGSESVEKKIIGLMIFDFLCRDSSTLLKSESLFDLYNSVGPNIGSKAKGKLPLTLAVEKSLRNLLTNEKALQHYADCFLALSAFQRLPFWFLDIFFQTCGPLKLQTHLNSIVENMQSLSEPAAIYHAFDSINNLIRLPSFKCLGAVAISELLQFQLLFCLKNLGRDLDSKTLISKLQTALTAHLRHQSPDQVLKVAYTSLKKHKAEVSVDDEIVEDVLKKTSKNLKKCEQLTESSSGNKDLLVAVRILLHTTYLWLHIDPVVVADFADDLEQILSDLKKDSAGRKTKSDINPVEVLCDLILRLLSSSSLFLRQVCEQLTKLMIPLLTRNCIDLFLNVLSTSSKSGLEDEILEDFDESFESDSASDDQVEDNQDADFNNLSIPLKRESDEQSEEEIINLDDADEKELALFDAKLCEIFKLKKNAKKAKIETKKTTIEFKSKVLNCLKIVFTSKSLNAELRLLTMLPLMKTAHLNMVDTDSKHIGVSLLVLLKQGSANFESGHDNLIEIAKNMCLEMVDFVKIKIWNNYALMETALACIYTLLKVFKLNELLLQILQDFWDFGLSSKKVQKTKYFSFLGIFDQKDTGCCWPFICSREWFDQFDSLNAQSKGIIFSFLLRSIKCVKNDQINMLKSFSRIIIDYYLPKLQNFPNGTKLSQVKSDVDLMSTLSRRCHSLSLPVNDWIPLFKVASGILDKNGQDYVKNIAKQLKLNFTE